jgi:hypothetical protein
MSRVDLFFPVGILAKSSTPQSASYAAVWIGVSRTMQLSDFIYIFVMGSPFASSGSQGTQRALHCNGFYVRAMQIFWGENYFFILEITSVSETVLYLLCFPLGVLFVYDPYNSWRSPARCDTFYTKILVAQFYYRFLASKQDFQATFLT